MGASLTAKNSELVLQTDNIEPAGIQEGRSADIVFDDVILDLKDDRTGIVIGLTVIVHRDDAGLHAWP